MPWRKDLSPDSMREASRRCYGEMLSAGYTSVTEFHYVHHRPDGTTYKDPNALAKAVVLASEDAGIRLLLLPVAYARGGLPRFRDQSVQSFLARVDALREWSEGRPLVQVGVAAHSVRAVPREWLEEIRKYAQDLPLHIHADEQLREIEECQAEHGLRPVELLAQTGFLGPDTTLVHATHADGRELDLLSEHGASVCACPTTEGNLGDGFLPAEEILERGIPLSVGSDSHIRIDPFEELREIEPTPGGCRGAGTSSSPKARPPRRPICCVQAGESGLEDWRTCRPHRAGPLPPFARGCGSQEPTLRTRLRRGERGRRRVVGRR